MHISALLDIDVIALESEDEITVAIDLEAPVVAQEKTRPPSSLQIVLDCSGSMGDGRLEAAKQALLSLVGRLDPTDNFGLVVFSDEAAVAVPAGPLRDKRPVRDAIRSIGLGGMTNLSGGYLRGIQEARRVAGPNGATLLIVSDGHANRGIVAHHELAQVATDAKKRTVTTSTLGVGLGYDESLLAGISEAGLGNAHFAEEADAAGALMAEEVEGLLAQVVQGAGLVIKPEAPVDHVVIWNDLPSVAIDGGIMVELGGFHSSEKRKLLFGFSVPSMAGLGLQKVADIELQYVELPSLTTHTVSLPIHVNVVPADEAAGRIPDPTVTSELAYQKAQRAKKEAGDALRANRIDEAMALYQAAGEDLRACSAAAPDAMAHELAEEAELLGELAARAGDEAEYVAKFSAADRSRKGRQRGRRPHGGG